MRKLTLLGAIVAGLGVASQPTDARDRGLNFRINRHRDPLEPRKRWAHAVLAELPLCAPAAAGRPAGAARQRIHQARAVTSHMLIVQTRDSALLTNCSAEGLRTPGAFLLPGHLSRRRGLPAPAQPMMASRSGGRWAGAMLPEAT